MPPPCRAGPAQAIPPELELLLTCARRQLSADHARRALRLARLLNWSVLLELARDHRLFPLLYWHWKKSLELGFPAEMAPQLDERFRASVARSLLLVQELSNVAEVLGRRGIPVVPFKGPALAENLYGNSALRECADLDVLLRRRDVPEALEALVGAGYADAKRLPATRQTAYITTQYEYPLLSPCGVLVELQWRIVPRYFSLSLDEEQYWGRVQPLTVCGREMGSLSPEDLLLFLCVHGGKHGWAKLIWLADVGELVVSNPRLDWEYIVRHAQRAGALRLLLLGVALSSRLLGTAIPADAEPALARDPVLRRISNRLARDLASGKRPTYMRSQRYLWQVRERWRDRLLYAFRFAFTATPVEWEVVNLPPALSGLYRLLRVLRGISKATAIAGSAVFRLARAKVGLAGAAKTPAR